MPHVPVGTPENVRGVCGPVEVVQLVLNQQRDARMRHNTQARTAPDVLLIPLRGCVVHPDHTLVTVYFFSKACTEHLPRARNQSTLVAVHVQELLSKHRSRKLLQMLLTSDHVIFPSTFFSGLLRSGGKYLSKCNLLQYIRAGRGCRFSLLACSPPFAWILSGYTGFVP